MKIKKEFKIVLIIIGVILLFASIRSAYNSYKIDEAYKITEATCVSEERSYR